MGRRCSQALGWLMNTRGLTELVVLNVGLSLGVLARLGCGRVAAPLLPLL